MISLANTGIRGWSFRVQAPFSATSIQVFFAMFASRRVINPQL
jgi:hypothetical protein